MQGKRKERCDGVRTREAILVAAEEEFAEQGFAAASTRAICARAGANNALVNRYYGTKENLYRIVAKRLFGDLGAPLAKLDSGVDTEETWRAAVRRHSGAAQPARGVSPRGCRSTRTASPARAPS